MSRTNKTYGSYPAPTTASSPASALTRSALDVVDVTLPSHPMSPTLTTRPRCERLADRTESDPFLTVLFVVPLLALVHPVAPAAVLFVLFGRRVGRAARSPTGHGRVRRPA